MHAARADAPRRRSELERRLDQMLAGSERVLAKDSIKDFVRLFNMCDISPPAREDDPRAANAQVRPPCRYRAAPRVPRPPCRLALRQGCALCGTAALWPLLRWPPLKDAANTLQCTARAYVTNTSCS